jgi:hypothetical protein
MSDDSYARVLNIIGLTFTLAGVLILFRWGMPFRVSFHGWQPLVGNPEPGGASLDQIYKICGWIGLILLMIGWACQIIAALLPPTRLG